MIGLIVAYGYGLFVLLVPLLGRDRMIAKLDNAEDQQLVDARRFAESRWGDYVLATWGLLCVAGSVFLLIRGRDIGWVWLGVPAVFAAAIVVNRWTRRRVLLALGDRGRVERAARYRARAATSYRWAGVGVAGYVGTHIIQYAYPHDPPSGAQATLGLFSLVMIIGALGFLTVRARMYLHGDDLEPTVGRPT